jgi:hypothetical protein
MTPELRLLVRQRRKAERKLKKPHSLADVIEYKRLKALVRFQLKKTRRQAWEEYTSTITCQTPTGEVWRKIGTISGKRPNANIRQLINTNREIVTSPRDKANLLAAHFAKNSSTSQYHATFQTIKAQAEIEEIRIDHEHQAEYNIDFSEEEMEIALNNCTGSSPGPDDIQYELLKQLSTSAKRNLLIVYNKIWSTGNFPEEWRQALVVAIPKPGKDPEQVENYRPIALTSCACKVMERMVNKRLTWYLEKHNLISNQQYGFRKERSTLDVLSILENEACHTFKMGHFMPVCSLDLSSAYDRCWRRGILDNMLGMNINGRLLNFASKFMSSRTIRVALGNTLSDSFVIENGVPQGAVISVTMFLIAINPITKFSTSETKIVGYADDWVVYSSSANNQVATSRVRRVIENIDQWTLHNGFSISANKTKCFMITRKRLRIDNLNIKVQGEPVEKVESHRILGLVFDTRLTWKEHLKQAKQKAEKKISILKCLARTSWGADQDVLLTIHNVVVLSTLRYGEQIYGSAKPKELEKLEATNNKGLRAALGAFCITKTEKLLEEAGSPTLEELRNISTIKAAVNISTKPHHPLERYTRTRYNRNPGTRYPQPMMKRATKFFFDNNIMLRHIEKHERLEIPPWEAGINRYIDTQMMAVKDESNTVKRAAFAEMTSNLNATAVFTDGSKTDTAFSNAAISDQE